VLTTAKVALISSPDFLSLFGKSSVFSIEEYGALTSIRAKFETGLEVEFGITDPCWSSKPLDEGTRSVLEGGYRVIVDKVGVFDSIDL
jgi:hypothetical protein